jgi:hypothetical protein
VSRTRTGSTGVKVPRTGTAAEAGVAAAPMQATMAPQVAAIEDRRFHLMGAPSDESWATAVWTAEREGHGNVWAIREHVVRGS